MGVTLRPATTKDAGLLYDWRADDEDNDWWEGEPVDWLQHLEWIFTRLDNPCVSLWVAELDGEPIGQARLDSNGELAFSVDKTHRRRGYGGQIVTQATRRATEAGWGRVKANVDKSNEASVRTLQSAGYRIRPDVGFMRWPT